MTGVKEKKVRFLVGLKPRRKAAKLTQTDLALILGTNKESVRAWEIGLYWPSAKVLPEMARALSCTIEELYQEPEVQDDGTV